MKLEHWNSSGGDARAWKTLVRVQVNGIFRRWCADLVRDIGENRLLWKPIAKNFNACGRRRSYGGCWPMLTDRGRWAKFNMRYMLEALMYWRNQKRNLPNCFLFSSAGHTERKSLDLSTDPDSYSESWIQYGTKMKIQRQIETGLLPAHLLCSSLINGYLNNDNDYGIWSHADGGSGRFFSGYPLDTVRKKVVRRFWFSRSVGGSIYQRWREVKCLLWLAALQVFVLRL